MCKDKLQIELNKARLNVKTDSYPMSIGELVSMYDDGELEIRPEFQRLFRWSLEQKSNFIESVLLGIPIPSIFVSQREDGVWELVDGLQRISTILSFMGKMRGNNGELCKPLKLNGTKYLPSLQGKVWGDPDNDDENIINRNIQRIFKREKIDIKIVQRESQNDTKYEIFQRLNTGGSELSAQEVRNALLLMVNPAAQHWIERLAQSTDFIETLPISQKQKDESYYNELVVRYLALRYIEKDDLLSRHSDVAPYLDQMVTNIFTDSFDYKKEEEIFNNTFKYLNTKFGEKAFKKYNQTKQDYTGAISMPIFEVLASGVSLAIERDPQAMPASQIEDFKKFRAELISEDPKIERNMRPLDRMKEMVIQGKTLFTTNYS
ncbi:GmrSD restriction endonuclease domain-containing protein [Haemophilus influenzae]|uniref:GmrSD restriction endonuclease domain-containing protein n=2 Tax=Haemophilus influenzae TaxID=727 RepID=UPI000D785062|nr:DUF262 domain-containing protein [Haemophilus influenzae]BBF05619.1 hypothetical protein CHBNIII6_13040 [Haemophilus influenzae]GBK73683.1 hypothetical protein NTHiID1_10740 [Haemophilus influenzae]